MPVGGCFCGNIRIESSTQPVTSVRLRTSPLPTLFYYHHSFKTLNLSELTIKTGPLPLRRLPQTHRNPVYIQLRLQKTRYHHHGEPQRDREII